MTAAAAVREAPVQAPVQRPAADGLAGLPAVLRLVLRRNRVRLAVWAVVLVGMFAYVGAYFAETFATQAALDGFATLSDTPSIKALTGLAAAPATLGGAVWTKVWMTSALALGFGIVFLVTRNGRADEEAGRAELLRSRMLGVHAYSAASVLVNAVLCVVVGLGVAVVAAAGGLDPEGAGIMGSLVVGASIAGVGLVALGVGAVAGQVASTSRGANALGSAVLGGFYLLRMAGDLGDGRLTWASPIGWGQEMQPWGANRWWPLGLMVALTVALLALAWWLEGRRDLGAGLASERPGPASAPARYASPLGLGLRLQRGPIIGWTLVIILWALMFGSVVEAMTDLLEDADSPLAAVVGGTGIDAMLSMLAMMMGMVTAVFAIQSAATLRGDEAVGIIEPQLAGALSRRRWALERLVIPAVGAAVLLGLGGAFMGYGYGALVDDPGQTGRVAVATLVFWPAVMVLVGVAVALFGWLPRLAVPVTWGFLAAMWFVVMIGDALNLPDWLVDLLPFAATPHLPLEDLSWPPLVAMTLVAAVLVWSGIDRFARRDVVPG